ncbi:MAG: hypothetical protein RR602_09060 [Longicatena sp.]|uniref:hypothetical protein n=1 Tax=Anaerorhabdus sp. TaxID=1872524 RepID=UPI002FC5A199
MDSVEGFWTWDKLYQDMISKYGDRVFVVDTKGIILNKSKWSREVVEKIFNLKKSDLKEKACHFSYIKFAIKKMGKF